MLSVAPQLKMQASHDLIADIHSVPEALTTLIEYGPIAYPKEGIGKGGPMTIKVLTAYTACLRSSYTRKLSKIP